MWQPKLFVPIGIPGSGKSTWCRRMLYEACVISSDEIRKRIFGDLRKAHDVTPEQKKENNRQVWDRFYSDVESYLEVQNVIADGTNLRDYAREKLRKIAEFQGATIHAIVFNNTTQAFRQNKERPEEQWVPDNVMNDFLGQFNQEYTYITKEPWDSYTEIGKVG